MKLKIKRIDKNLPLPEYKSEGATAFDFYSRREIKILPNKIGYVPLNTIVEIPNGYALFVFARSGTHKKGLILANGVGVIDPDFRGEENEINAVYFNFLEKEVIVEKGERIAQGIIQKIENVDWEEVEKMNSASRGAFGSTGKS